MTSNIPNTFQHPNDFVDRLLPLLSDMEVVVLTFATRKILGWEKKRAQLSDRISLSQFETTGRSRPSIIKALAALHAANILIADKSHAGKTGAEYELNLGQRGAYCLEALGPKQQRQVVKEINQLSGFTSTGKAALPQVVKPLNPQNPLSKPTTKPKRGGKPPAPAEPVPPAVKVFQQVREKFPPRETWDTIAATVGDEVQSLELWRAVLIAYAAQGWNRQATDGPLDWFKRGELPRQERKPATKAEQQRAARRRKYQDYEDYWDAKEAKR